MTKTTKPGNEPASFPVTSMEFAPPQGADLRRCLEIARGYAQEFASPTHAPKVSFSLNGLRVTVQAEGVATC